MRRDRYNQLLCCSKSVDVNEQGQEQVHYASSSDEEVDHTQHCLKTNMHDFPRRKLKAATLRMWAMSRISARLRKNCRMPRHVVR